MTPHRLIGYLVRSGLERAAGSYLHAPTHPDPRWTWGRRAGACVFVRRDSAEHFARNMAGRVVRLVKPEEAAC